MRSINIIALLLISLVPALCQHKNRHALRQQISSILTRSIADHKIPGAVIAIKKGDRVLMKKAFGFAQVKDAETHWMNHPKKTSTRHLYDLASLTKVVGTTTAIMLLADQHRLSVDDPVGKYLPAFNGPEKQAITLRNLLTHTAGLITWYPLYYRCKKKEETYRLIDSLPLATPVGAGRHYSDLGFVLLGEIIEKISGQPLEVFLQAQIFKPLGMHHTFYRPLDKNKHLKIAATSHGNPYEHRMVRDSTLGLTRADIDPESWNGWRNYTLKGEVNDGNAWYALQGISGAAGLFSTAGDVQILVDMLKNKGLTGKKRFLSEKTITQFFTPDPFQNGLGWMMDPTNGFLKNGPAGSFGHTGFTGTSIAVIPKQEISIILLINRQNVGLLPNQVYYNPNPIREAIFKAVMDWDKIK